MLKAHRRPTSDHPPPRDAGAHAVNVQPEAEGRDEEQKARRPYPPASGVRHHHVRLYEGVPCAPPPSKTVRPKRFAPPNSLGAATWGMVTCVLLTCRAVAPRLGGTREER